MHQLSTAGIVALALLIGPVSSNATTGADYGSLTEEQAQAQLEKRINDTPETRPTSQRARNWHKATETLGRFGKAARQPRCQDAERIEFNGAYILSKTSAGEPCRIYDLSFPTLKSTVSGHTVSRLPVQKFSARNYLDWAEGRYEKVTATIQNFNNAFSPKDVHASWVAKLKFKQNSLVDLDKSGPGGLPATFRASDLDVGERFTFSQTDQSMLRSLIEAARVQEHGPAAFDAEGDPLLEMVDKPTTLLSRFKFVWNDVDKVYDVVLDGEFLPLRGPITMVDFSRPWKGAIEGMIRAVLASALTDLVTVIPEPMTRQILTVVVEDTFTFLESAYTYQLNMLEATLRAGAHGDLAATNIEALSYERGVDLTFATRTGFFTDYIMAIAAGKKFDWTKIEQIGHTSRYRAEKARDISMDQLNSRLVLKGGCESAMYHDYFALCTKKGKQNGIYSLLSQPSIFFFSFGAPLVYRFERPYEVTLKRATTWLLSAAVRMVPSASKRSLVYRLGEELKGFALAGVNDEAFLRAQLRTEKLRANGAAENEDLFKWLFVQNINPFLPKTEASENAVIEANRSSLQKMQFDLVNQMQ